MAEFIRLPPVEGSATTTRVWLSPGAMLRVNWIDNARRISRAFMAFSVRRLTMRLYLLLTATGFFGTFFSIQANIQSATWRLFRSIIIMWLLPRTPCS